MGFYGLIFGWFCLVGLVGVLGGSFGFDCWFFYGGFGLVGLSVLAWFV